MKIYLENTKCVCCKKGEVTHSFIRYDLEFECCATCFAYEVMKEKQYQMHPLKIEREMITEAQIKFFACLNCDEPVRNFMFFEHYIGQKKECPNCKSEELFEVKHVNLTYGRKL